MKFLYFAVANPTLFKVFALPVLLMALFSFMQLSNNKPLPDDPALTDGDNTGIALVGVFKLQYGIWNFIAVYGGVMIATCLYIFPAVADAIIQGVQ